MTSLNDKSRTSKNKFVHRNQSLSVFMQSAMGIRNELFNTEYKLQAYMIYLLRKQESWKNQYSSVVVSSKSFNSPTTIEEDMNEMYCDEIDKQLRQAMSHLQVLKSLIDQVKYNPTQELHQIQHYKSVIGILNQWSEQLKSKIEFTQNNLSMLIAKNQKQQLLNTNTLFNESSESSENQILFQNEGNMNRNTMMMNLSLQQIVSTDLQDAHDTEIAAIRISEMLTVFESKIHEQNQMVELFHSNTEQAIQFMEDATSELRKASGKDTSSLPFPYNILPSYIHHLIKYFMCYLFVVLGLLLLMYDRIKF
ncbi:hypothetical protein FDP41_004802 [Naegleria fowleri]|uniref:Uncharacterized protein n=1 Tax=Naegleria fowleri TaxID=5763 RepID=A0A6A5BGU9_NAEFO|nr:uncharacterized protein FDP41_004802 [Naegleria fowleri]KAF0976127.1 hypothetical protein FDP41_004802 [Naegleria fowleri]